MKNTKIVTNIFTPLIGQVAWKIQRGYGSFMTMEFGRPHLEINNPSKPRPGVQLSEAMKRRRVFPSGEWHLWVQDSDWKASAFGKSCNCMDAPDKVDAVLKGMDGQKLVSAGIKNKGKILVLSFDLGGKLAIPLTPMDPQLTALSIFSLHNFRDSKIESYERNGVVGVERGRKYAPGSITVWSNKKK